MLSTRFPHRTEHFPHAYRTYASQPAPTITYLTRILYSTRSGCWILTSVSLYAFKGGHLYFLSQSKFSYSFKVQLRLWKAFPYKSQCLPIYIYFFWTTVFSIKRPPIRNCCPTVNDLLWHSTAFLMRDKPPRVKIMSLSLGVPDYA